MYRHPAHRPIHPFHLRRRTDWRRTKRTLRLIVAHAVLQLGDGHLWNALALTAMAGLAALPAETISAHAWLRTAVPILLATIGMAAKTAGNHPAAKKRIDHDATP